MSKKILASLVAVTFTLSMITPPSFAQQAIVLSDEQLDAVYARGFNNFIDFSSYFAQRSGVNTSSSPSSNNTQTGNGNSGVQILSFGTGSPQQNSTAQSSSQPNSTQPNSTPESTAAIFNPIDNQGQANISTDPADLPQDLGNTASNLLSSPSDVSASNNVQSSPASQVSANDLNPAGTLGDASSLLNPEAAGNLNASLNSPNASNTPINVIGDASSPTANDISQANDIASIPLNLFPTDNGAPEPVTTNTPMDNIAVNNSTPVDSNVAPVENSQPTTLANNTVAPQTTPTTTNNTSTSTNNGIPQLNLVATQNSNGGFEVGGYYIPGDPTAGITPPEVSTPEIPNTSTNIVPIGNGGTNVVNVSDLSQQHLSALFNINSAGSNVNILMNLVINMGDNTTINNNNSLSTLTQNFFQIQ